MRRMRQIGRIGTGLFGLIRPYSGKWQFRVFETSVICRHFELHDMHCRVSTQPPVMQ